MGVRNMKVLFIMHNCDLRSGATAAMMEVIRKLPSSIETMVLFPSYKGSAVEFCKTEHIPFVSIPYWSLLLSQNDTRIRKIAKYVQMIVRKFLMAINVVRAKTIIRNIDLIYTNTSTIKFGMMLSKYYRIPHIWHIREHCDLDHGLKFPFGKKLYYRVPQGKNVIVVISESLKAALRQYIGKNSIKVIYDDVDEKYINPVEKFKHCNDETIEILIAGDIKKGKGQFEVVKAIGILISRGRKNIHLNIAGKTSDPNYKIEMEKYIRSHKMEEYVSFLGVVSDMNKLRLSMDIGIIASVSEAFGRVTVEGMLSKMAMIGRNSGATPELIKDEGMGLLYNGSFDDLADKIEMLLDDEKRQQIARKGFDEAVNEFARGRTANEVYELIIDMKRE